MEETARARDRIRPPAGGAAPAITRLIASHTAAGVQLGLAGLRAAR